MQGFKTVPPHTFSCTLIKAQPKTHTHARAWCGSLRDLPCFGWYSALHTRDTAITITKYKKKKKKSFSCMASSSRCVPITDYTTRHDISITRYRYRLNIFGSTIRTDSRFPPPQTCWLCVHLSRPWRARDLVSARSNTSIFHVRRRSRPFVPNFQKVHLLGRVQPPRLNTKRKAGCFPVSPPHFPVRALK